MGKNSLNISPSPLKEENSKGKLDVKVRLARPEEWQKLRDFRFKIFDEDTEGNIASPRGIRKMKQRTDEEWKDAFFGKDILTYEALVGSEIVCIGRIKKEKEIWYLFNLGTLKEFRGRHIAAKLTATRLNEIKVWGGKEVRAIIKKGRLIKKETKEGTIVVKKGNFESQENAKSFGFKRVNTLYGYLRNLMVLDDVNNPITTKRIEEILKEE
ncbi:MAG: GNAT family N-acetyltransferase [Candidatus Paceibacterota bacterium]|jgi:ribosomal protein S18 acetylase RimI-like enzyme